MSADRVLCECGKPAVETLRIGGVPEPICRACLERIAGGAPSVPEAPIVEWEGPCG